MKRKAKPLALSMETLRRLSRPLTDEQLQQAAGGKPRSIVIPSGPDDPCHGGCP